MNQADSKTGNQILFRRILPYCVASIILLLSVYSWQVANEFLERQAQERFNYRSTEIADQILEGLRDYETILRGSAGLFAASENVTGLAWRDYVQTLDIRRLYPGIQGIGFVKVVEPSKIKEHTAEMKAEGFTDYSIYPSGDRDLYTSIIFLEPFDERNQRAIAYDMFSEPTRRAAMERARDTGKPQISGKVKLIQEMDDDVQPGFVLYMPLYKKGHKITTTFDKEAKLFGYVGIPFRMKNLVDSIFGDSLKGIDLKIFDGTAPSTESLMYKNVFEHEASPDGKSPHFTNMEVMDLFGHKWTLIVSSRSSSGFLAESYQPLGIMFFGCTIAFFTFLFLRSQERTKVQAVVLANEMTSALVDSEERFRTAFMTSPDSVTISSLTDNGEGFFVDVNEGFCEFTGYKAEEVLGKSSTETNIWDNPQDKDHLLSTLKRQGQVANLEMKFRLKNGSAKTVLVSARVMNLGGEPHILTVTRDIDEWKKAEQSLRKSEERFRQVADLSGDWIWEVDEKGVFSYCSSAVLQVLGYNPEELVGQRNFLEITESGELDGSVMKLLDHFNRRLQFHKYITRHAHKDGRIVIMETSGTPIMNDDGLFTGYRGANTDITERVRASESQELLAAVVEHAAESIVVTDTNGAIKYVNPAFEQTCGYSKDEAIGVNPRILKSGKHSEDFYAGLWETIARGDTWRGHFVNRKKDGSLFEEDATISPLRDATGQIANYVGLKRDVTKEVSLQNQLAQSQKMEAIGTLAGGIAHDFNNILFAIIGYTEMAIEDLPVDSRPRRDMGQVLSAAKRAAEMVKRILTFSRQTEPQRILLDLAPIVKEGLKFLRGSIPSTIEIRQKIESSLGMVEADPTQIHQVLMNLCSNAGQAMKDTKGIITVELAEIALDESYTDQHISLKPGRYVKLSVSDTGYGIPRENIGRIFDPYFTTKGIGEGTGLGLAVIHGIVSSHGGSVTVHSIPGQGSTFNVFLPVVKREAHLEIAADSSMPMGTEKILLVDDEETLVVMGQAILERLGYQVVTSTDPLRALEVFSSDLSGFNLVLTDLMMPKMTGLELAKQIKTLNPEIPIILCTGFGNKFSEEEVEGLRFSGIIRKPMSNREVAQTVRKALDPPEL